MKRLALVFLFLIGLLTLPFTPANAAGCTGTGTCYWEGGTGNWSDTTKWCTTDTNPCTGSTGGVPSSADNVFFTASSNATAYTVTVDATAVCLDMSWALPSGSGVPTLTLSAGITVTGSLTLATGQVWTAGPTGMTFGASTTGKTITTNGVVIGTPIAFNGGGGGWTLAGALEVVAARTLTVTNGTLNTNAQTVTTGFFVSTSGTRTLTLDGSTINITGTSGTPWNVSIAGTLTWSATGSTINFTGGAAGVNLTLTTGNLTYGAINITGAGLWSFGGNSPIVASFSYTSTTNKTDSLRVNGSFSVIADGALSIVGNSTVNRAFVQSTTFGTTRTITISGTTVPTLTNVDFQDITASGSTPWTGTSLGDALGNSGITFDASVAQTYAGGGGNWSTSALWTSRVPLPQDDVTLPASSAGTLTADMPRLGRNIASSAFDKTLSFASTPNTIFGNIALGASGTYSGTQALTLAGRGSHTITSNGKAFPQNITIAAFGGTYTLQDTFAGTPNLATGAGTFTVGAFDVTVKGTFTLGTGTTVNMGTGTWYMSRTISMWVTAASATLNAQSSTIQLTGANVTTATFGGGGYTYNNLHWSSTTSTGALIITGANTFADFKIDGTTARTVTFPSSTTTTMGSFTRSNQGTAVLTINSSTPATAATLSDASGANQLEYLSIRDSTATGGATWDACNSTSVSGNTGWNIYAGACPAGSASRLMMTGVSN